MKNFYRKTVIAAAGAALLSASLHAQAERPRPQAPTLNQPTISLEQAVRLGLTYDPTIQLSFEDRLATEGVLQETSGLFDRTFQLSLDHSFERGQLLPGPQRKQAGQRRLFRLLAEGLQRVADGLRASLEAHAGERVFIDCNQLAQEGGESVLSRGSEIVIIDPQTGKQTTIRCTTPEQQALEESNDAFLDALIAAAKDPEQRKKLQDLRAKGVELSRATIEQVADILDQVAAEQRERLRRLGVTPTIEEKHETTLFVGLAVPFRSGVTITPTFVLQRTDVYNVAKRTLKDSFGGRSVPTTYRSALGFRIDAPLLRGRGYLATAGPEIAAKINLQASDADYQQSQSISALRTALDYWSLVGAQQRLALAEESLGRQQQLAGIARQLQAADEITRIDVMNVDARIADAQQSTSSARGSVIRARIALARDIGLRIEEIDDAPLASDSFPAIAAADQVATMTTNALLGPALARRFDIRAAERRHESSKVILETAQEQLRRRLDLSLSIAYLGFQESQNVGKGLSGALFDEWVGPSVLLSLSLDWPFENNTAIGRFAQANALENQSDIVQTELKRRVETRITNALGDLQMAAAEVRRQEEAARLYRRTIDDQYTKYRAGESTIVDYILTEENLTNTLATLIDAREAYAVALTRLRFETGLLVRPEEYGTTFDSKDVLRLPF